MLEISNTSNGKTTLYVTTLYVESNSKHYFWRIRIFEHTHLFNVYLFKFTRDFAATGGNITFNCEPLDKELIVIKVTLKSLQQLLVARYFVDTSHCCKHFLSSSYWLICRVSSKVFNWAVFWCGEIGSCEGAENEPISARSMSRAWALRKKCFPVVPYEKKKTYAASLNFVSALLIGSSLFHRN